MSLLALPLLVNGIGIVGLLVIIVIVLLIVRLI